MSRATIAGCGAIALWSCLALLSRAAASLPPLELTALCFAVSGTAGLGVLAAAGRLGELAQPPIAWAHGVSGLFGYHALYFAALALAPAAEANLLNYAWPLLIVVLSGPVLGMRLTVHHAAGAMLAAAGGVVLLSGHSGFTPDAALGDLLALASAFTWALYSVLARRLAHVPTSAVAGFCAASALLAAAAHFAFEPTITPNAASLTAIVALGLGPVGGAFFLWDFGMKHGDPRLLGTLAYATPVASTLLLVVGGWAEPSWAIAAAAILVAGGGAVASGIAIRRMRVS